MNLVHHRWRDLQNLSLKGSLSVTLISCFARSVQLNSPSSKEKMSLYSASRAYVVAQFLSDHPPGQTSPAVGRAPPFSAQLKSLLAASLESHQASFNIPGDTPSYGMAFTATTWAILTPLAMVISVAVRLLHHNCYLLAPCSHLSIGIHDAQPIRQAGTISLLQGLCHHLHVAAQKHGLSSWNLSIQVWYLKKKCPFLPS